MGFWEFLKNIFGVVLFVYKVVVYLCRYHISITTKYNVMENTVKGFKKLVKKVMDAQEFASEVIKPALEEKREWWENKSEKWQESEAGQQWQEDLDAMETFVDEVCDNADTSDFE